eukprot:Selendium_serpulae@DN4444_c0_g1_i4.p1
MASPAEQAAGPMRSNAELNGRVGKKGDICYSWWVLASLKILNVPLHRAVDTRKLLKWMMTCQSPVGGFRKSTEVFEPDLFHTFFGLAALSLMAHDCAIGAAVCGVGGRVPSAATEKQAKTTKEEEDKTTRNGAAFEDETDEAFAGLRQRLADVDPVFAMPKTSLMGLVGDKTI